MLKITLHDSAGECRFHLEGRLCGAWVAELEMCWQTAASTTSGRRTTVDLSDVDFVDDAGRSLLERMHAAGVRFAAVTPVIREIVRQIAGDAEAPAQSARPKKSHGLHKLVTRTCLALVLLFWTGVAQAAVPDAAEQTLDRYLTAAAPASTETATEVDIHASLPKMGRSGVMRALEYIPSRGRALFRVLGFDGDSMVKRQVIARYLSAEAQAHQKDDGSLSLSPANYKFHFKMEADYLGRKAWVWRVEPRKRRVGLYKGELWLDASTARPLRQWGRFVKNPSVFVKHVDFVRDYDIVSGAPRRLIVNLDAVFAGAADLTIWYRPVAEGPKALAAFQCDTGEKPGTAVAERADVSVHTEAGFDACAL